MELQDAVRGKELEEVIGDVLKGKWDHERSKFSLPPLMNLVSTLLFYLKFCVRRNLEPHAHPGDVDMFLTKNYDENMPLPS